MKGLAGGLITNSQAAMAYMTQFDNVVPIWGIQRMAELDEWLSYMENTPSITPEVQEFFDQERAELQGEFCRGCGYCLPCAADIPINNCARMSLMIRRAPSSAWLSEEWQENMARIEDCTECEACKDRCPYGLDVPNCFAKITRTTSASYREKLSQYKVLCIYLLRFVDLLVLSARFPKSNSACCSNIE